MAQPFYQNASLDISAERALAPLEQDPLLTYDRIHALASLAVALDPTLGQALQFIQVFPDDGRERVDVPFQMFFTPLKGVFRAPDAPRVEFWEGLARVFKPEDVQAERNLFAALPKVGCPTSQDAAIRMAFRAMKIAFRHEKNEEGHTVISQPSPIEARKYQFQADLCRRLLLTPVPDDSVTRFHEMGGLRKGVHELRDRLAVPFRTASDEHKQAVLELIARLNQRNRHPLNEVCSFEKEESHGWVAYALSQNSPSDEPLGWTSFLMEQAGCSPHVPYGTVLPLAVAIATNDAAAVEVMLSAGVSPDISFLGWPRLFNERAQASLENVEVSTVSPLLLAAAVDAQACLEVLLKHGAHPETQTLKGLTPLSLAAMGGQSAMVEVLLAHGANPAHEDHFKRAASHLVPEHPECDALYQRLEAARLSPPAELKPLSGFPAKRQRRQSLKSAIVKKEECATVLKKAKNSV